LKFKHYYRYVFSGIDIKSETILEEPQKIALLGSLQILRINNVGRKSLREISSALCSLKIIKNEGEWLYPFLK
jgi:DNA-directed RNA polymerase alpha subunit